MSGFSLPLASLPSSVDFADVEPFAALAADLADLGPERSTTCGERLVRTAPGPWLQIVKRGVLCLTHETTGLCTSLVGPGFPIGQVEPCGLWLTDGAVATLSFDALSDRYGPARALRIWMRAADLSRHALESELICAVRHSASRRFARWFLAMFAHVDEARLTQSQLARLSGLQRTSACASMAILQSRGALTVMRGRVSLADRSRLASEACCCGHGPISEPEPGSAISPQAG